MKYDNKFFCPKCQQFTGWGTSNMKPWKNATGHCHGRGDCCGFTWPRKDDHKYFQRVGQYKSRAEFKRMNPPITIRFTTKLWFGDLPTKKVRKKKATIVRNMSTPENRKFWKFIDKTAKEVEKWPAWKRGGSGLV